MDYFDSGQFGDAYCKHCDALLLNGEADKIKLGRLSPCCANGACQTKQMVDEYSELQDPPIDFKRGLAESKDDDIREEFLSHTMPLNNSFAFASIHHGAPCPEDQLGGRKDTCKYNGLLFYLYFF